MEQFYENYETNNNNWPKQTRPHKTCANDGSVVLTAGVRLFAPYLALFYISCLNVNVQLCKRSATLH